MSWVHDLHRSEWILITWQLASKTSTRGRKGNIEQFWVSVCDVFINCLWSFFIWSSRIKWTDEPAHLTTQLMNTIHEWHSRCSAAAESHFCRSFFLNESLSSPILPGVVKTYLILDPSIRVGIHHKANESSNRTQNAIFGLRLALLGVGILICCLHPGSISWAEATTSNFSAPNLK